MLLKEQSANNYFRCLPLNFPMRTVNTNKPSMTSMNRAIVFSEGISIYYRNQLKECFKPFIMLNVMTRLAVIPFRVIENSILFLFRDFFMSPTFHYLTTIRTLLTISFLNCSHSSNYLLRFLKMPPLPPINLIKRVRGAGSRIIYLSSANFSLVASLIDSIKHNLISPVLFEKPFDGSPRISPKTALKRFLKGFLPSSDFSNISSISYP